MKYLKIFESAELIKQITTQEFSEIRKEVDTWFLPSARHPQKRFIGHTFCDQLDGLVGYIEYQIEQWSI
jgi:hypothetical protein